MPRPIRDGLRLLAFLLLGAVALAQGGCISLMRENVLATTNTVTGLSIAYNPQSQLPELKVGYARAEFFYVPTSKRVAYDDNGERPTTTENNDPSRTPEVLAVIGADTGGSANAGGVGADMHIAQALAVGARAVESPVAIAVFARNAETARAAASAVTGQPVSAGSTTAQIAYIANAFDGLKKLAAERDAVAAAHVAALNAAAVETPPPLTPKKHLWDAATSTLDNSKDSVSISYAKYANADRLIEHLREMNDSVRSFDFAIDAADDAKDTASATNYRLMRQGMISQRDALREKLVASPAFGNSMRYYGSIATGRKE